MSVEELVERAAELHRDGRVMEASAVCRDILRQDAGNPAALHRLGLVTRDCGNKQKAVDLLLRASKLLPDSAEVHADLGKLLVDDRNFMPGIQRLEIALALDPARGDDYLWLATAYSEIGRSDRVLETCDRALKFVSQDTSLASRIAGAIMTQGRMEDALPLWRRAVEQKPDAAAHSALLFCLHYVSHASPEEIAAEHRHFAELHEAPLVASARPYANVRDPRRRLRIGYVSPDFKMHPVATFLEPVLARHDREHFETFCYSACPTVDERTRAFRRIAGPNWREIFRFPPEHSAELVRRDAIDILVDLAGHTGGSQLMLFARKPAPVQVTWLGYPNTTGLGSMDWRITDGWADPPGMTEHLHSEKLLRLPCFLSYQVPDYAPEVAPPPALRNGFVTFGSFNNFMKIAPETLDTWAEILRATPASRLVLKHRGASDQEAQSAFPRFFEQRGVARERIVMTRQMPSHRVHLDSFRDIDIALDPFPYNGTTTTCETLAMGVPVVTLAGRTHVSRVGVSFLAQVGLTDWIAESREEYVRLAVAKSATPDELARLRRELRPRLQSSELGDPGCFTARLEAAYRAMWEASCSDVSRA